MRTLPPPEDGPVSLPAARLTPRATGMMMVLRDVQITADSVIGWREGDPDPSGLLRGPSRRVAVHRSEVLVFEPAVHRPRAAVAAVVLTVALAYVLTVLYAVGTASL